MCYCHKNRHVDQWNRIESKNKSTYLWSINRQKRRQGLQWKRDSLLIKCCWESWSKKLTSLHKYVKTIYLSQNKLSYIQKIGFSFSQQIMFQLCQVKKYIFIGTLKQEIISLIVLFLCIIHTENILRFLSRVYEKCHGWGCNNWSVMCILW